MAVVDLAFDDERHGPGGRTQFPAAHFTSETFRARFVHNLRYIRGLELARSKPPDRLAALALTVREALIERAVAAHAARRAQRPKTLYYLSLEYLLGRMLWNNLIATNLVEVAHEALATLGLELHELIPEESDPGLGNGGLGRLAACYLESLATLNYPAFGYGLRYDFGIFRQQIRDGWQHEAPDMWHKGGYPWEIPRPDMTVPVRLGGHVEWHAEDGARRAKWVGGQVFYGVPYDVLVAGYGTRNIAVLRLWGAEAPSKFDLALFSRGDFLRAVENRETFESITKVLYPSDEVEAGRRLRLAQEYFLVACSVRDVVNRFRRYFGERWEIFAEKVAFQLNDTHPALTIAELQRFFVDEIGLPFAQAFEITTAACGYTNHTLLPEALETWPVSMVEQMLPRHAQLILDINQRFLETVATRFPGDLDRLRRVSLVNEEGHRLFRMAHLAIVGSHRVNGVAKLHAQLMQKHLVRDFAELWPERFIGITNGVTPRRWLLACNPRLAATITNRIGDSWTRELDRLRELAAFAQDPSFQGEFLAIKQANKIDLGAAIENLCRIEIDPDSMFDVQAKRLHEYKRQLLNAMHIIALYHRIKADPAVQVTPRTFIFGAKAAPAYHMAKLIIKLINAIAEVVNKDRDVAGRLRVVFLPDYRVSLAEKIIPAADLSEQISTAGKEASGTGNMKLALNGALTIGTLDGANIEIRDAVGEDNIFIFGLAADEIEELRRTRVYDPWALYHADQELAAVIDALRDGAFVGGDGRMLREIWSSLMERGDAYMHLADFRSYVDTQASVATLYRDPRAWAARAIRNIAAMGAFSSDRAVHEYARQVWDLSPIDIPPNGS